MCGLVGRRSKVEIPEVWRWLWGPGLVNEGLEGQIRICTADVKTWDDMDL